MIDAMKTGYVCQMQYEPREKMGNGFFDLGAYMGGVRLFQTLEEAEEWLAACIETTEAEMKKLRRKGHMDVPSIKAVRIIQRRIGDSPVESVKLPILGKGGSK